MDQGVFVWTTNTVPRNTKQGALIRVSQRVQKAVYHHTHGGGLPHHPLILEQLALWLCGAAWRGRQGGEVGRELRAHAGAHGITARRPPPPLLPLNPLSPPGSLVRHQGSQGNRGGGGSRAAGPCSIREGAQPPAGKPCRPERPPIGDGRAPCQATPGVSCMMMASKEAGRRPGNKGHDAAAC